MVDFGYNNNAIRKQKHFKLVANGIVAIVAWLSWLKSHFNFEDLKKNGSLNVNLQ